MIATAASSNTLRGIRFIVFGMLIISLQDVIIKQVSGSYPVHQIVAIRSAIALAILIIFARYDEDWHGIRSQKLWVHLLRGVILFVSYTTYYLGVVAMPLANAVSLFFVSPLFVTLLSILLLRERVKVKYWAALAIGFVGTIIMLRPGVGIFEPAALLPIAAAATYALTVIMTRRMGSTESGMSLAIYATAVYLICALTIGLIFGNGLPIESSHPSLVFLTRPWVLPTPFDLGLIGMTGFTAAIGFFALSQAYRVAEATAVAPFEYIALPLSVVWGFMIWRELPDLFTIIGVGFVIAGGLVILPRRPQRKRWVWPKR